MIAIAPRVAGDFNADYSTPGSESQAASKLIRERFPGRSGEAVDVVWQNASGVRRPAVEASMQRFLSRASQLEGIGRAERPRVSPDGTIAVTRLDLDRPSWDVPDSTGKRLIDLADSGSAHGLRIELGGGVIESADGGPSPELIGILAAAAILLVAFGSVVAAGLPLVTALFGLGISGSLIGVLAAAIDVPDWSTAVAGLIGIGVGIDYALLVITRFRTALAAGREPREAVVEATSTAGRSVLIAGSTVVIPWTAATAGAAVLLALSAPLLTLQLGFPDAGNDRRGTTTRAAYDLISRGFGPGANGPLVLAAELPRTGADLGGLARRLRGVPGVAAVGGPQVNGEGNAALLTVVPTTSPQDSATAALVRRLHHVLPDALAGTGTRVFVGGRQPRSSTRPTSSPGGWPSSSPAWTACRSCSCSSRSARR